MGVNLQSSHKVRLSFLLSSSLHWISLYFLWQLEAPAHVCRFWLLPLLLFLHQPYANDAMCTIFFQIVFPCPSKATGLNFFSVCPICSIVFSSCHHQRRSKPALFGTMHAGTWPHEKTNLDKYIVTWYCYFRLGEFLVFGLFIVALFTICHAWSSNFAYIATHAQRHK